MRLHGAKRHVQSGRHFAVAKPVGDIEQYGGALGGGQRVHGALNIHFYFGQAFGQLVQIALPFVIQIFAAFFFADIVQKNPVGNLEQPSFGRARIAQRAVFLVRTQKCFLGEVIRQRIIPAQPPQKRTDMPLMGMNKRLELALAFMSEGPRQRLVLIFARYEIPEGNEGKSN